jgi:hypothetical protein
VLGEERRIGADPLPIDRWMIERLHGESGRRPRRSTLPPVAWHGRFAPSVRSAEPDLVLPPVIEPPAATTAPPSAMPASFGALDLWGAHEPQPRTEQTITPRPIMPHSQLDPEVRALVDDLYDQARAELSGGELLPEPAYEPPVVSEPTTVVEPPADPTPSANDTTAITGNGHAERLARSGWVPAFVAEEQRRRQISD